MDIEYIPNWIHPSMGEYIDDTPIPVHAVFVNGELYYYNKDLDLVKEWAANHGITPETWEYNYKP